MSILTTTEIARRAPVWEALSELFVGKELQPYDYQHIASRLSESGYTVATLDQILRDEVAPTFFRNLGALAIPEIEGWTRESVTAAVLEQLNSRPDLAERLLPKAWMEKRQIAPVKERWKIVQQLLTAAHP